MTKNTPQGTPKKRLSPYSILMLTLAIILFLGLLLVLLGLLLSDPARPLPAVPYIVPAAFPAMAVLPL